MQVHLIRHTKPEIAEGICYGQSEVALAHSFPTEKQAILKQLDLSYDAIFSSPLLRCTEIAQAITTQHYQLDKRLLEMNFGKWELKSWDDIPPAQLNPWMNDFIHIKPESGENLLLLNQRVIEFIKELLTQSYEKVAIVTHAGVIRIFWAWILGIPLQNIFRLRINYGDIYTLRLSSQKAYCTIHAGVLSEQ